MALTTERINQIREELERFLPLSREDREELLAMALAQASQLEGGSTEAAKAETAAEDVVKKVRGKKSEVTVATEAPPVQETVVDSIPVADDAA